MINTILKLLIGKHRLIEWQFKTGRLNKGDYYDALTELIMKNTLKSDSVCIDVGCHKGSILKTMIKHAPSGTFFAFEPIPDLFEKLKKRFTGNNIHIYDIALSNREELSDFNYVTSNPAYSGLIKRQYDKPHEEDCNIKVKTRRLDSILSNADVKKVDFIKSDVEGGEYFVIEGAQEHISRDKPIIVFEHGKGGSDCYGITPEAVFEILHNKCGLHISLMQEWLNSRPPLTQEEFCNEFYNQNNYYFIAHK